MKPVYFTLTGQVLTMALIVSLRSFEQPAAAQATAPRGFVTQLQGTFNGQHVRYTADVMLPWFERRRRGEDLSRKELLDALVKEIGPAARAQFEAVIVRGETITPESGAFGPCFERKPAKFEVQSKEVDGFEWVRVATVPDDRCRAW